MVWARRVASALAAMAATFGALSAGAALAHRALVTAPVAGAMRVPGVLAYRLQTNGGAPSVAVQLADEVDLEAVCQRLTARLTPILGSGVRLVPAGPGQASLTTALEAVAVPVEQGIATGDFVAMARAVGAEARARGLSARVEVDAGAVYVTLTGPGGRSAYALFPRSGGARAAGVAP
ncbi:MAG: hypothetical protein K6V73_04595 [Firmicutes bacterium]|nr:hypothetical protein [Bacillota bacterium]